MNDRTQVFVGGRWIAPHGRGRIEVVNPATAEVAGSVPACDEADVNRAVAAASGAFPAWSTTPVKERIHLIRQVADELEKRAEDLASLISTEVGTPLAVSLRTQIGLPVRVFAGTADVAAAYSFEEHIGSSVVVREAVGVVAAITPWNYPLYQIAAKTAPALVAGCTIVVKPSEVAPLSAFVLAEILEGVGLPAGVFNLLTGDGVTVGEPLASHPEVDMISFTGSGRIGRRVAELGAASIKRVSLELGGKSANLLLEDADLERAVPHGVEKCFSNAGQTCAALTRMIVPRQRLHEVEALAKTAAESYTTGSPFDPKTRLGPVASAHQLRTVRGFINTGAAEGARILTGGSDPPAEASDGFFVRPTVFTDVRPDMTIAQEEIFGPVLCIIPYDSEDEAVEIANGTVYGLSGGVWSVDPQRARAVAARLRTGQVSINGRSQDPLAPFGGFKQSGVGREIGIHGLEEYLELKSIAL